MKADRRRYFVCHSRADAEWVDRVIDRLLGPGIAVYPYEYDGSDKTPDELVAAICRSHAVLVFIGRGDSDTAVIGSVLEGAQREHCPALVVRRSGVPQGRYAFRHGADTIEYDPSKPTDSLQLIRGWLSENERKQVSDREVAVSEKAASTARTEPPAARKGRRASGKPAGSGARIGRIVFWSLFTIIVLSVLIWVQIRDNTPSGKIGTTRLAPRRKLVGKSLSYAREYAQQRGLRIVVHDSVFSDSFEPGMVVAVVPRGPVHMKDGDTIKVTVSRGRQSCPSCGAQRRGDARNCTKCGHLFATGQSVTDAQLVTRGKNAQGYEEFLWLKDSSVMVKIPAGKFRMGSNDGDSDEKPVRQVYLDEYLMDKLEVTKRQYKMFCDATGRSYPPDPGWEGMHDYFNRYADYPVVNVSWDDAKAYCDWAGKRLPTEAEWEKAARGTDVRKYPWGNEAPDAGGRYRANYDPGRYTEDGYRYTSPVGSFPRGASPYGLLDMAGNVWEWCNDWYDANYYGRAQDRNPQGPSSGSSRVRRGGSWYDIARLLRSSRRFRREPSLRDISIGFRCVRRQ